MLTLPQEFGQNTNRGGMGEWNETKKAETQVGSHRDVGTAVNAKVVSGWEYHVAPCRESSSSVLRPLGVMTSTLVRGHMTKHTHDVLMHIHRHGVGCLKDCCVDQAKEVKKTTKMKKRVS